MSNYITKYTVSDPDEKVGDIIIGSDTLFIKLAQDNDQIHISFETLDTIIDSMKALRKTQEESR